MFCKFRILAHCITAARFSQPVTNVIAIVSCILHRGDSIDIESSGNLIILCQFSDTFLGEAYINPSKVVLTTFYIILNDQQAQMKCFN